MSNDLEKLVSGEASTKDIQIAELEAELQSEKDLRREERFIWFLAVVILGDLSVLPHQPVLGASLIFTFELLLVILVGRACGIDDVEILIQRLSGMFSRISLPTKKGE